jgi:Peptidase family M50
VKGIASLASYGLGLASVLLLFASILAHEFGHALVARRRGVEIGEIDLWLLGGVSRMKGQPKTPGDELAFALAGPAVTAVIAAVFGAVWLLLPSSAPSWLRALIVYEAEVNALILMVAFGVLAAFGVEPVTGSLAVTGVEGYRGDANHVPTIGTAPRPASGSATSLTGPGSARGLPALTGNPGS